MKQIAQTLKNGEIQVLEVPPPIVSENMILVKNHFSLISPGTEGSTVRVARTSLYGKVKERPQQFKQVLDALKKQGPLQTYRAVKKRLEAYSPLGYSTAGEVIEAGQDVRGFEVGDLIACSGGGYANHAEIIAVPHNLCVKLPPGSDTKRAVYNTLGAIALQGIRQADPKIGETCVVIGLGLIGQLTCLMLRAGGVKVVGIDIDSQMVSIARENCTDMAFERSESGLESRIEEFTQGVGADAVIIAAATKSLDPINLAGQISRKKGKVVVVGDIPTGFERETYYRKELDLRMSCSYGPGRYDVNYEEKGIDYPVGYVRWTERRNMQAFQDLIHSGKIDIDYLTTHIFDVEDARKAYDLILNKDELFLGILIKYDVKETVLTRKIETGQRVPSGKVNIAFIGAGSYAQSFLLPNIPDDKEVALKAVHDSSGTVSKKVAEKYGFEYCTSDAEEVFANKEVNTVYVATRHNSHADYVLRSLKTGKNVHVEKPLCLNESELTEIKAAYEESLKSSAPPILMVGFNRRFSPLTELLVRRIGHGPMAMIYRINSGKVASDHWVQDPDIGGGRIIGEVCHFVDLLTFINGSLPDHIHAHILPDPEAVEDTVSVNLKFQNGSIGTISYYSNGAKSLFKEYVEIYRAGVTGIIKDFKELVIYEDGKAQKKKLMSPDKGQRRMIDAFIASIKEGKSSPIGFEDIHAVTLTTFRIIESLRSNKALRLASAAISKRE